MTDLVTVHDHPPLSEPVLVVALEGWIDAGNCAAQAMATILATSDTSHVASFDGDQLLDHRARRPLLTLDEGWIEQLTWPSIELLATVDRNGRHLLLLVGAEPDHAWGRFTGAVMNLITTLDVRAVIGLGAYPAPVPHTRPSHLALTSPSRELLESNPGFVRGSIEVPAGVQSVIEVEAHGSGIDAFGLWAQVPHYITGMSFPAGAVALIEGLQLVAGLSFDTEALTGEAIETRTRLDELVAGNSQHQQMLRQLEELADATERTEDMGRLPTADELAEEFQQFLRDQDE
ncbi:MAG: PAC2 family protein [Microthrixaceae bacterium]